MAMPSCVAPSILQLVSEMAESTETMIPLSQWNMQPPSQGGHTSGRLCLDLRRRHDWVLFRDDPLFICPQI
ncbi:hypothetical protein LguiB_026514 [Lonicera macranthoides]